MLHIEFNSNREPLRQQLAQLVRLAMMMNINIESATVETVIVGKLRVKVDHEQSIELLRLMLALESTYRSQRARGEWCTSL